MDYLFYSWDAVESRVRGAGGAFIFSDYDGTLTPIAEEPNLAVISEGMKRLLESITVDGHFKLAIVSGRSVGDIKKLVEIEGAYYAGNHGLEMDGPNFLLIHPEAERFIPTMISIQKYLQNRIGRIQGVIIENKKLTISIHYRKTPEKEVESVRREVASLSSMHSDIIVTMGKKVFEVRPKIPWGKGKAASWLLDIEGERKLPIFLGDDETDEDAFETLTEGITILVSEKRNPSKAQYYLRNIKEVRCLLQNLLKIKWLR